MNHEGEVNNWGLCAAEIIYTYVLSVHYDLLPAGWPLKKNEYEHFRPTGSQSGLQL